MKTNAITSLILIVFIMFGIFKFFSCIGGLKNNVETIDFPPFVIKKKNKYGTRYDINTARKTDNSRSYYSIFYKDQLITFPNALNENTGVSGLWKAHILSDSPQPALLAGSKSVYLITEENNSYKLTPISEQNSGFASLQWLDNKNGQPSPKQELYSSNDTGKDCKIAGGQFLLVNKNVVLDLNDLSIYPFEFRYDLTDNYSPTTVIAFSPDKDKLVYMGSKYNGKNHYALLVYNFKNNQIQTVPFDRTETRLHEVYDLKPEWFSTYFIWTQDENNNYFLEKISHDTLPNWQGHFTKEKNYSISPVKKEMQHLFAAFIKKELNLSEEQIKLEKFGSSERYNINLGKNRLGISFFDDLQSVYFSIDLSDEDEEGSKKMIEQIGSSFNEQLKSGEHQSLFTAY